MNSRCKSIAVLFVLLAAGLSCVAQGGPPLRTDDPGTPGNGNWEANVAATADRRQLEKETELPLLDINYGLGDRIQLKFEIPWVLSGRESSSPRSGLGNSLMGVKWRFFENKEKELAVSCYPQLELNNPNNSVHREIVDRAPKLLLPIEVTKKIGPVDVNLEAGYRFARFGPDEWISGLAVGKDLTKRLEVLSEVYGTGTTDNSVHETTFDFRPLQIKRQIDFVDDGGAQLQSAGQRSTAVHWICRITNPLLHPAFARRTKVIAPQLTSSSCYK